MPWNVHDLFIIWRFLIWNDAWDVDVNVALLETVLRKKDQKMLYKLKIWYFFILNIALKTGQFL